MNVVSDSSPLIILAKIGYLDLLPRLYPRVCISSDVYREVALAAPGLPGASEIASARWVEVMRLQDKTLFLEARERFNIGAGEIGTILLAKEIQADVALIDDLKARRMAQREGIQVRGTVGLLEVFYRRGDLADLRSAFQRLLTHDVYVDRQLLNRRLQNAGLSRLG